MIDLDAASVLLQWATGGLFFLWITTRRREVSLGYGWTMRGTYILMAAGAAYIGIFVIEPLPVRDAASATLAARADHLRMALDRLLDRPHLTDGAIVAGSGAIRLLEAIMQGRDMIF